MGVRWAALKWSGKSCGGSKWVISLQGRCAALRAAWLFLWVVSTSLRKGPAYTLVHPRAASSLNDKMNFTSSLLTLLRHHSPTSGSIWKLWAVRQHYLIHHFHLPTHTAHTRPRMKRMCVGRTQQTAALERETWGRNRAPVLLLVQDDNIYFYPFFFKENIIPRKLMWIRGKVSGLTL